MDEYNAVGYVTRCGNFLEVFSVYFRKEPSDEFNHFISRW